MSTAMTAPPEHRTLRKTVALIFCGLIVACVSLYSMWHWRVNAFNILFLGLGILCVLGNVLRLDELDHSRADD